MRSVSLAFRFALELAALAAFATYGLHAVRGPRPDRRRAD